MAADTPRLIETPQHTDERGSLTELWSRDSLHQALGTYSYFAQANLSVNKEGVLRGIHYSRKKQGKLISCVSGKILDVAVDLRLGSPTFGDVWQSPLGPDGYHFWVPAGFGHAFCAQAPNTNVIYHLTSPHSPEDEDGIYPLTTELSLPWSKRDRDGGYTLSERDTNALTLVQAIRESRLPDYEDYK